MLLTIILIGILVAINLNDEGSGDFQGGDLEVHFIDVGHGDSILIKSNKEAMLIDGGTRGNGPVALDYIQKEKVKSLKYIVGTHPHEDHIGGLGHVIENMEVENIIMPRATTNTQVFEKLLDTIEAKGGDILEISINHEETEERKENIEEKFKRLLWDE